MGWGSERVSERGWHKVRTVPRGRGGGGGKGGQKAEREPRLVRPAGVSRPLRPEVHGQAYASGHPSLRPE